VISLQIITASLIGTVLAADLIFHAWVGKKRDLVSSTDLILLAMLIFVVFIDEVYKFTVGLKGSVFERRAKAVANLQFATGDQKIISLEAALQEFSGRGKDIWSRMILYRLSLRTMLRGLCLEKEAVVLNITTPMSEMIEVLVQTGVIATAFAKQLNELDDTTFFFESGTGDTPTQAEIEKADNSAPRLLKALAEI
jgi:hypothetical protein